MDVLVVTEERAFGEALMGCLPAHEPIAAVRSTASALETLHVLDHRAYDLVLLCADPASEPADGEGGSETERWQAGLVQEITRRHPDVSVVVVSPDADSSHLNRLVRAGARGWVPSTATPADIRDVLVAVRRGLWWLPRELLGQLVDELSEELSRNAQAKLDRLTYREGQILLAMSAGLTRADIGRNLGLSVNTVRTHIQNLMVKLDVHSTLQAVSLALRAGLNPADPQTYGARLPLTSPPRGLPPSSWTGRRPGSSPRSG